MVYIVIDNQNDINITSVSDKKENFFFLNSFSDLQNI